MFVDPHKIFALSLKYLVEQRGLKRRGRADGFDDAHDRSAGEEIWIEVL